MSIGKSKRTVTEKRTSHTLTPVFLLPAESQYVSAYILEERKRKGSILCYSTFYG